MRCRFLWSLRAERNGFGEATEQDADGAVVRRFRAFAREPFPRWLLSTEADVELVSPPSLAAELHELAREVAALYV